MFQGVKLVHFCGMVIFLGSIITFIVISTLIEGAPLEDIAFGRRVISAGTNALTLPGMWILAITGVWMGYLRYGLKSRFFQIKLALIALIIINAYTFVVPAVAEATALAGQSNAQGQLLPEYKSAYMRESIFGAINVFLTVLAGAVGVWRVGAQQRSRTRLTSTSMID